MKKISIKRAIVFAHYDKDNMVDEHIYYYLRALCSISDVIVFVTTSKLSMLEVDKLSKICTYVILRDNIGYDFMSYKTGIDALDLSDFDELVVCNDSVYGPICSLEEVFQFMETQEGALWGITESYELNYHLQSYFLVFRGALLQSDAFIKFWSNVKVIEDKKQLIKAYEVGLSQEFLKAGFSVSAFISSKTTLNEFLEFYSLPNLRCKNPIKLLKAIKNTFFIIVKTIILKRCITLNITHFFWDKIILDDSMPFLKVELLRDNPMKLCNIASYKNILNKVKSDYPVKLIDNHLNRIKCKIDEDGIN